MQHLNNKESYLDGVVFRPPAESLVAMLRPIDNDNERDFSFINRKSNNRIDRKLTWMISSFDLLNLIPCGHLLFLDFDTHEDLELEILKRAFLLDDLENAEDPNFVALKFDLISSLTRCGLVRRETDGKIISIEYNYHRLEKTARFEIFNYGAFSSVTADESIISDDPLRKIDFLLSQYSFYHCSSLDAGNENEIGDVNIFAKGLEGSGRLTRKVLQSTGSATGEVIRFLGRTYTSTYIAAADLCSRSSIFSTAISSNDNNYKREQTITHDSRTAANSLESAAEQARRRRNWAESIHSGARVFTSTALYPVRWTGRKASELAADRDSNVEQSISTTKKILLDTMGGLGNGLANVCKGVTEVISEVGDAIGDSAMHHSRTIYGEEYANNVTKAYVDAAGELGLAGYKICNVASLGLPGIIIDAAIEGTSFMISLEDYLMGPVLQHGNVDLVQLPNTELVHCFVVMRPWSIAFYRSSADILEKPFKIISTAMLDTIPILRQRGHYTEAANEEGSDEAYEFTDIPTAEAVQEPTFVMTSVVEENFTGHQDDISLLGEESPSIGLIATDADVSIEILQTGTDNSALGIGKGIFEHGKESFNRSTKRLARRVKSTVRSLMGGDRTHIELCTVDCSTYLLYFANEQVTSTWYNEVSLACNRVETIEKRRSGAEELAFYRRLSLLPKKKLLRWRLLTFMLQPRTPMASPLDDACGTREGDSDDASTFFSDFNMNEENIYGDSSIAHGDMDRVLPSKAEHRDRNTNSEIRELQRKFSSDDYEFDNGYNGVIDFEKNESVKSENETGNNRPRSNFTGEQFSGGMQQAKAFISGLSGAASEAAAQLLDRAVLVATQPKTYSGVIVGTERYVSVAAPLLADPKGFIAQWGLADESGERGALSSSYEFGRVAGIFNKSVENHDHCTAESMEVIVYFKAPLGLRREAGRGSLQLNELQAQNNEDCGPVTYTIPIFRSSRVEGSNTIGSVQVTAQWV